METQSAEKVFYQDGNVTVTQSRFVSSSKTYAMRNISSVSIFRIAKSRAIQIILIIVGALCLLGGTGAKVFGFVLAALGILWLVFTKDDYSVRINSNSGEADGFVSEDYELVRKIVDAVNEAIIFRG